MFVGGTVEGKQHGHGENKKHSPGSTSSGSNQGTCSCQAATISTVPLLLQCILPYGNSRDGHILSCLVKHQFSKSGNLVLEQKQWHFLQWRSVKRSTKLVENRDEPEGSFFLRLAGAPAGIKRQCQGTGQGHHENVFENNCTIREPSHTHALMYFRSTACFFKALSSLFSYVSAYRYCM